MKKAVIVFFTIICMTLTAYAADDISVYMNGERMSFEQEPIIRDDYTLVPFRAIFEKLDMTVQWFGEERRVTAQKEGISITLFIDGSTMYVNEEEFQLATPAIIYNNFTLVPLRAVAEAAKAQVDWDGDNRTVTITYEESNFENWAQEVLELTNDERAKKDLAPLEWDDSLAALAETHCEDMINRGFFAHNNPDGLTPFDRMKNAGISYYAAGENIAAGQYSPKAAVEAWMNSEGHRENILNPDFKCLGVSVVKGGKYGIYWAQEFAQFKQKTVTKK